MTNPASTDGRRIQDEAVLDHRRQELFDSRSGGAGLGGAIGGGSPNPNRGAPSGPLAADERSGSNRLEGGVWTIGVRAGAGGFDTSRVGSS